MSIIIFNHFVLIFKCIWAKSSRLHFIYIFNTCLLFQIFVHIQRQHRQHTTYANILQFAIYAHLSFESAQLKFRTSIIITHRRIARAHWVDGLGNFLTLRNIFAYLVCLKQTQTTNGGRTSLSHTHHMTMCSCETKNDKQTNGRRRVLALAVDVLLHVTSWCCV